MIPLHLNFDYFCDVADCIKIFVGAAASDFDTERHRLMTKVYKKVRKYCRNKHGIDCYICDMAWGREYFLGVHPYLDEIRSNLLKDFLSHSFGPYFLVLFGQKYTDDSESTGLPHTIPNYAMNCIKNVYNVASFEEDVTLAKNRKLRDFDVWKQCYLQDENSLFKDYAFNVSSYNEVRERIERNYVFYSLGDTFKCLEVNKKFEIDKKLENINEDHLILWVKNFLDEAVRICTNQNKIENPPEFFKSRFHKEIELMRGSNASIIMKSMEKEFHFAHFMNNCPDKEEICKNVTKNNANDYCFLPNNMADVLVIKRTFTDLQNFLANPISKLFGEIVCHGDIKYSKTREQLEHQGLNCILQVLSRLNVKKLDYPLVFRVPHGIDTCFHASYLDQIAKDTTSKLKEMIDERLSCPLPLLHAINREINEHLRIAHYHTDKFIGREEILMMLKNYLYDFSTSTNAFIIHGFEASGKAAIASKVFKELREWFGYHDNVFKIIRFIGATYESRSLIKLMTSLLIQMKLLLHGATFDYRRNIPRTLLELSVQIEETLCQLDCFKCLLLVIVGVDKLTHEDQALTLNWLSKKHASNVKIILTMESNSHTMKWVTRLGVCEDFQCFELPPLNVFESTSILLSYLAQHSRTLCPEQLQNIQNVCFAQDDMECMSPLYPQVLACHFFSYSSFHEIDYENIGKSFNNLSNSFSYLLQKIEETIGYEITSKIINFLSFSYNGLGDNEMEDILTRDSVVSAYMKMNHQSYIKFPSMAWAFVKYTLKHLLWRRYDNEISTWSWKHSILSRLSTERYVQCNADIISINFSLAEHWIGDRTDQRLKQVLLDQPLKFIFKRKKNFVNIKDSTPSPKNIECDKRPVVDDYEQQKIFYNRRKLIHFPKQLIEAERKNDFMKNIAFNFDWLVTKTEAFNVFDAISDLKLIEHPEVVILLESMMDAYVFIDDDVNNMAYELTRRLLMFRYACINISNLIDQMDRRAKGFIVGMPLWRPIVGALESEFESEQINDCIIKVEIDNKPMIYLKPIEKREITMYDPIRLTKVAVIKTSRGRLYASPNGKKCCVLDCCMDSIMNFYDVIDGKYLGNLFPLHATSPSQNAVLKYMCLLDAYVCYVVEGTSNWLSIKTLQFPNAEERFYISLRVSPAFLSFSPDQSHIYTGDQRQLIICCVENLKLSRFDLPSAPYLCCSDSSSSVIYLALQVNDICMVNLNDGPFQVINLSEVIKQQVIRKLTFDERGFLLILCNENIIIYDVTNLDFVTCIDRPCDVPKHFRFPGDTLERRVNFEDAILTDDYIIVCILRDIMIWRLDGSELTVLKTPIGRLKQLIYVKDNDDNRHKFEDIRWFDIDSDDTKVTSEVELTRLITVTTNSPLLQAWDLKEKKLLEHFNPPDRLSPYPINFLELSCKGSVVMASSGRGREVGIFDPASGHIKDLFIFEGSVVDIALSMDGSFSIVSLASSQKGKRNKILSVHDRKVLGEFGTEMSINVSANLKNVFYCFVSTSDCRYRLFQVTFPNASSKNESTQKNIEDRNSSEKHESSTSDQSNDSENVTHDEPRDEALTAKITNMHIEVNSLSQKPFVTCQDGWLVCLTINQSFCQGHFLRQNITALSLKENEHVIVTNENLGMDAEKIKVFNPSSLQQSATSIKQILRILRHPSSKHCIIIFFSNQPDISCCDQLEEICEEKQHKKCSCHNEKPKCYLTNNRSPFCPPKNYKTCFCSGLLMLNLCTDQVEMVIEDLLPPCTYLDRLVISRDAKTLFDSHSNIYDLTNKGAWNKTIEPKYPPNFPIPKNDPNVGGVEKRIGWPISTILDDTALLYLKKDYLTLVRLEDHYIIGRICVHTFTTSIGISSDQRTVYIGGLNGTVSSYIAVDFEKKDDPEEVINNISSRKSLPENVKKWDETCPYPEYSYKPDDSKSDC